MAKLSFVLLAHEAPKHVAFSINTLIEASPDVTVAVHYDANAPQTSFSELHAQFAGHERVAFVEDRAFCRWGEFGLVDGVVRALRTLRDKALMGDHVYLISGSCMPVRPISELIWFLSRHPTREFIQCKDKWWIKDGLREERYIYRHYFNFMTHPKRFNQALKFQKKFRLKRRFPEGLTPRFGSQWWCLTRPTCETILSWIEKHPRDYTFFRTTWIPDELFFQSLVFTFVDHTRIHDETLTYYKFNANGRPITYYDGADDDSLPRFPFFFVRKVAPGAKQLRARLAKRAAEPLDPAVVETYAKGPLTPERGAPRLGYETRFALEVGGARPGQIFYRDQRFTHWPGAMGKSNPPFVLLYGPTAFTQAARKHFENQEGFTVFGRLFHPKEVDFGPQGDVFHGLRRDDVQIRNFDPPLYLARVLERTPSTAVITLTPGDAPHAEGAFLHMADRALVVPCIPFSFRSSRWFETTAYEQSEWSTAARRLFWSLCALDLGGEDKIIPLNLAPYGRHRTEAERRLDDYVNSLISREHQRYMNDQLRATGWIDEAGLVHVSGLRALYWGDPGLSQDAWLVERGTRRDFELRAGRVLGRQGQRLVEIIDAAEAATRTIELEKVLAAYPAMWRDYFANIYAANIDGDAA